LLRWIIGYRSSPLRAMVSGGRDETNRYPSEDVS